MDGSDAPAWTCSFVGGAKRMASEKGACDNSWR